MSQQFDAAGRFVLADFGRKRPFSSFLPGIAGLILTIGYLEKILSLNAVPEAMRLMLTGAIIVVAVMMQRRRRI